MKNENVKSAYFLLWLSIMVWMFSFALQIFVQQIDIKLNEMVEKLVFSAFWTLSNV